MTNPAHPGRMLFVNLPVADLERSKAVSSRDEVDTVSAAALAAGGSEADDAEATA